VRIPFGVQSYQQDSLPISAQRMVNCYLEEQQPGSSVPVATRGTPGIKAFATFDRAPIRGLGVHSGVLYAVAGDSLYSVTPAGAVTLIGSVGGSSSVCKLISNGSQLAVLSDGLLYIYDGALTQVTDPDYRPSSDMAFIDSYILLVVEGNSGQFIWSNLLDASSFDGLDFATAEANPDSLVGVIVDHREIFLLGEETTEVWVNTGSSATFERISGAFVEIGCKDPRSAAKADNTIFWWANDNTIRRLEGYVPRRVSTHAIETKLATVVGDVEAFTHTYKGHVFYVLSHAGGTFVLDVNTGLWHERESYTLNRWRARGYVRAYGKDLVGDFQEGRIGELDALTYQEFSNPLVASAASPAVKSENNWATHGYLELEFETGVGLATGQGSSPEVGLRWSDDGGRTWGNPLLRSLGAVGDFGKVVRFNTLGRAKSRVYEFFVSDPVPRNLLSAWGEVRSGRP